MKKPSRAICCLMLASQGLSEGDYAHVLTVRADARVVRAHDRQPITGSVCPHHVATCAHKVLRYLRAGIWIPR